ncbi:MAG: MEDS domain-containing protein [Elusimicrobia bacterium]|nr:MEDS domain-containing protein [Elusimicrobiota bacterium]
MGYTPVIETDIAAARSHDHLCLLHKDEAERVAALVPFFRHGLARGERCVYIGDAPPNDAGFEALITDGLSVLGTGDAYLKDGRFDLERMLGLFRELADPAGRDRPATLRVAGEASWILAGAAGTERFFEYESRVNDLFAELDARALCLYDRKLFSPGHLHSVLRTHPLVIHRGAICRNSGYEPPAEFLSPERTAAEIDRRLDEIHGAQIQAVSSALPERIFQEQRLAAVGRLAGGVAHEFNNILTALLGAAQYVEDELPADSASRADTREITRLGRRAAALTNQLLCFAQRRHFQPRRLDLSSAVAAVANSLRPTQGAEIALSIPEAGQGPFVHADPGALEVIVTNLLVNAREAMPSGGRIGVCIETVTLSHPGEEAKDYALIRVTDTGTGMTPESQVLVFDPFFSTKDAVPGSGLGLSAVYGLVRQSGGYIEVRSAPGQGTTFRVYLPLLPRLPSI